MAKKPKKSSRPKKSARVVHPPSKLTREEFWLNKHDEEKVLLFVTGLVFGMGVVASILDKFFYAGIAMLVVGLVLLLMELNVEERQYKV